MWIARDSDGTLYIYKDKPERGNGVWITNGQLGIVDEDLFPEVQWSDPEPRELVLKPIKEEQGFVNLYKDGGQVKVGWKIFPTKKEAEENFKDDEKYITTANIQWRESNDNL